MEKNPVTKHFPVRYAAYAGLAWCAFQVAMMLYSGNLSLPTVAINVAPVLLLSLGALRANRVAVTGLAVYGALRLWMALPILSRLLGDSSAMPKHWWIALVAVPFALVWMTAGYTAQLSRRASRSR